MPDTPGSSNAETALAAALGRLIDHFGQAADAYNAGRALALGFQQWLAAERASIAPDQRDAVLSAIASAREAIKVTIPRASLARIEDGLDALAEDVAAACGAPLFETREAAAHCARRIMLAQSEAATVAMLVSALFDELESRPRALVTAAEWQARSTRLAIEIAECRRPEGFRV